MASPTDPPLSVLIPLVPSDPAAEAVLAVGLPFARRHGRYVEGTCLRPSVASPILYAEVGAAVTLSEDLDRAAWEAIPTAREMFEAALRTEGLALDAPEPEGLTAHFQADVPAGAVGLAQHARLFDVTVLARPTPDEPTARMGLLEAVLFESGRAVLLVPPNPPAALGEMMVVAWNGSTESARALAFARPVLAGARRVVVLSVEGGVVPGPSGAEAASSLRRLGIGAEARHVPQGRGTGPTILEQCQELGADLLVKGADTQSRLRQIFFGGATRHVIEAAHLPVLMAH